MQIVNEGINECILSAQRNIHRESVNEGINECMRRPLVSHEDGDNAFLPSMPVCELRLTVCGSHHPWYQLSKLSLS